MLVEWDPESGSTLADVTAAGFASDFVLSEDAVHTLQAFSSWHSGPVEVVNAPANLNLGALADLLADLTVSADLELSSIELESQCGTCGMSYWHLRGAARRALTSDEIGCRISGDIPRRDLGIVVRRRVLDTSEIFKVEQFPAWTLVTDSVRDAMTEAGLSGVRFFEVGSTID